MDWKRYRKKPVAIDSVQIDTNSKEFVDLIENEPNIKIIADEGGRFVEIHTLEGTMRGYNGDYLIRGVQGEYYSCKRSIFEQTYEPV